MNIAKELKIAFARKMAPGFVMHSEDDNNMLSLSSTMLKCEVGVRIKYEDMQHEKPGMVWCKVKTYIRKTDEDGSDVIDPEEFTDSFELASPEFNQFINKVVKQLNKTIDYFDENIYREHIRKTAIEIYYKGGYTFYEGGKVKISSLST